MLCLYFHHPEGAPQFLWRSIWCSFGLFLVCFPYAFSCSFSRVRWWLFGGNFGAILLCFFRCLIFIFAPFISDTFPFCGRSDAWFFMLCLLSFRPVCPTCNFPAFLVVLFSCLLFFAPFFLRAHIKWHPTQTTTKHVFLHFLVVTTVEFGIYARGAFVSLSLSLSLSLSMRVLVQPVNTQIDKVDEEIQSR